jgi:seryl-tRNA synthetase
MFDIRAIRNEPVKFDANWARRGVSAQAEGLLSLDEQRRAVQTQLQELQAKRNTESQKIGEIKKNKGDASAAMAAVAAMKEDMANLEVQEKELADRLNGVLSALPNMLAEDVPEGKDESANKEVRKWGEIKKPKGADHADIGEKLGLMDFETAVKMSGSRFTILKGGLARLERALAQFFLDTHASEKHGFTEVSPPLLVRDNALYGTGQLPKFEEDLFKATTDHYLIPTSEIPLTNIVADMIVEEESLPRRYTAFTPCFRSEAGSAGRDTRGMLRQHQFYKVEMVSITTPDKSEDEQRHMVACAETVLKKLELPFRTIILCAGDTGFGARRTYDIEVWLPGQETYREISSVSTCGDFQARRMNARCRAKGEKDTKFVHTLNGSGVAVGRALIAVMENYHDPSDGGIFVPDALKPYMGGVTKITGP